MVMLHHLSWRGYCQSSVTVVVRLSLYWDYWDPHLTLRAIRRVRRSSDVIPLSIRDRATPAAVYDLLLEANQTCDTLSSISNHHRSPPPPLWGSQTTLLKSQSRVSWPKKTDAWRFLDSTLMWLLTAKKIGLLCPLVPGMLPIKNSAY